MTDRKRSGRQKGENPDYDYTADEELDYSKGATALDRTIKQRARSGPSTLEDTVVIPETSVTPAVSLGDQVENRSSSSRTLIASLISTTRPIKLTPKPIMTSTTATATPTTTTLPITTPAGGTGGSTGGSTGSSAMTTAPTTVVMAPVLPGLNPYNGKSSATVFMNRFIALALASRWDKASTVAYFPMYLTGTAQNWYLTFSAEHRARTKVDPDWDTLNTGFLDAFKPKLSEEELEQLILFRTKQEKELIQDYFYEILKLCDKADTDMKVKKKIKYLLKGLLSEIALEVYNSKPVTIQDVLSYYERRDKFSYLIGKKADVEKLKKDDLDDMKSGMADFQTKLDLLLDKFSKLSVNQVTAQKVSKGFQPRKPNRNYNQAGRTQSTYKRRDKPERTPDGKLICYGCRKAGHIKKDCRSSGTDSKRKETQSGNM